MNTKNKLDSKERIIKAALTLWDKKGYLGTSIQDIVDAAELTKGSFYYYFDSKDDLLYLIHDQFVEFTLSKAMEIMTDANLSNREKMRMMIHSSWESMDNYKEHITIINQEMKYINSEKFKAIKEKRDRLMNCFITILKDGTDSGEFKNDIKIEIAALSINGMISWAYQWYKKGGSLSSYEIAEMQTNLIFNSLLIQD